MKVGKEGIFGVMAALEHRMAMDVDGWQDEQDRKMNLIIERMRGVNGVTPSAEPDPNGNPFSRARLDVDATRAGLSAAVISAAMAEGDPSIRVRGHHVDEGYIMIDAIEMSDDEVDLTCRRLVSLLTAPEEEKAATRERLGGVRSEPGRMSGLR